MQECNLRPGDHLCCIYDDEKQHQACMTKFMLEGLEWGQKVVYLAHSHSPRKITGYLQAAGVDTRAARQRGQLEVRKAEEVYTAGGGFDPEGMLGYLEETGRAALEAGFAGLRLTGEMAWVLEKPAGGERLMEYECRLNSLATQSTTILLCQYERKRFSPAQLLEAVALHPLVVEGACLHANAAFSHPEHLAEADPEEALLRRRLQGMNRQTRMQRTLERQSDFMAALLDAVVVPVMVLDGRTRVVFFNEAAEKVTGRSLVEVGGRPLGEMLAKPTEAKPFARACCSYPAGKLPGRVKTSWQKGREQVSIAWACQPLCDSTGRMEYLVATGRRETKAPGEAPRA